MGSPRQWCGRLELRFTAVGSKREGGAQVFCRCTTAARAEAFEVVPQVLIDNKASNRFTVLEVAARDRPALLLSLAFALFQSKTMVHSAHIATFGERAVDTFYVTDLLGGKLESKARLATLERRLVDAATNTAGDLLDVNAFAMSS